MGVSLSTYVNNKKQQETESNNQDYAIKCVNKNNIMGNLRETAKYVFKILNYFIP